MLDLFDHFNTTVDFITADLRYVRFIHDLLIRIREENRKSLSAEELKTVKIAWMRRNQREAKMFAAWGIELSDEGRGDGNRPMMAEVPPGAELKPRRTPRKHS